MLNSIIQKFKYGKHIVTLETGMIARQATSSIMVSMDDTTVFVTVVATDIEQKKFNQNLFSLNVNYQERTYAVGRFPGSFFRREGRPNEHETLISRLIDRPIRPLFPKNFFSEIQIIATTLSVDPQINPDIVAMIGTSAALNLSGIPFNGPIGAARIGYINNEYILNPTQSILSKSKLDLVIASTTDAILMVESKSKILSEDQILDAISYGHNQQKIVIDNINDLTTKAGKSKWKWKSKNINLDLQNQIIKLAESRLKKAYSITEKKERYIVINNIKIDIIEKLINKNIIYNEEEIKDILYILEKKIVRNKILFEELRIDGRKKDMIRKIDIQIGILPRTHGSALFTRGETQALVTTTLGTEKNAQNIDKLIGERTERFLLHYNFLPYCIGEIGIIGSPKRREIGHGYLARNSIVPIMPNINEFPYTIRVVSEITESNGSSSMATVCGTSLSLMDAGVPIKSSIAGIAMGLVKENDKFVILSDILGDEDHLGDMDFKVAGSYKGITSLQMDIKTNGITQEIIYSSLNQAKIDRIKILNMMENIIKLPRNHISKYAPRIYTIKIDPNKIKNIIGKGGSVIRALTEETETTIEIEDDGIIKIVSTDIKKANYAIDRIKEITEKIEVGRIYNGKVTRIVNFGAFVTISNGKEGLVHISQITNKYIEKITDHLKIGQKTLVKVLEIDHQGRIGLSIKDTISLTTNN